MLYIFGPNEDERAKHSPEVKSTSHKVVYSEQANDLTTKLV